MPVVRYRTRDLTRLLPGTARAAFRRMEKITGRTDDMMIVRGVNVFPSQIEELILKHSELAPHYQCVLGKEGPLDTLTVRVECNHGADPAIAGQAQSVLAHDIKAYIGVTAAIEILPEGGVERSVGKARRIVDNRPR
jgi:phenylacetate-CoA ligase